MTIYQSSELIYQSNYLELYLKTKSNALFIKWLPENIFMNNEEFTKELYLIFEVVRTIHTECVLFDSYYYNHLISPTNLMAIRQFVEVYPAKSLIVSNSKYALGRQMVNTLACTLSDLKVNIFVFNSEDECDEWFSTNFLSAHAN
jgi:alpha-L-fucosidase